MRRLSLNAQIAFVLSLFVIGSIAISYISLSKMAYINNNLKNVVEVSAKRLEDAHLLKELLLIQLLNEKNYILERDPKELKLIEERIEKRALEIKKIIADSLSISTEKGKEDLNLFASYYKEWTDNMHEIEILSKQEKYSEAFTLSATKGREIRYKAENLLNSVAERNSDFMVADYQNAEQAYTQSSFMVLSTSVGIILFGLIFAFLILYRLSSAINQVINNLNTNSIQVTTAANQIAASSEELSQAANEQASSLQQTSSAIEEMNSMIGRNAENATQTSTLASNSHQSAARGKNVVKDMINAIADINESNNLIIKQVDESNKEISNIINVINEIANKTRVINDIVFQTKLLSFNASVEAARAGEHGKGFAVVAEEVGSLAQMSGNAAKEISDMLESSTKQVEAIVNGNKERVSGIVTKSRSKIDLGGTIAKDCGSVLDEIVKNITEVSHMAGDISNASQEQAQGIQEITRAMGLLDQVTQTNAATSEEAASSAEELSGQAISLRESVTILIQTIKGGKENETAPRNVLYLKPKEKTPDVIHLKKVSGSDVMPSEDDPRFKEV